MSTGKQSHYDEEFRQSCAKLAFDADQPVSKTAAELGIKAPTLYVWIKKYHPSSKTKSQSGASDLAEENKRLKKELLRVTEEREILKKAAAYFAKITE